MLGILTTTATVVPQPRLRPQTSAPTASAMCAGRCRGEDASHTCGRTRRRSSTRGTGRRPPTLLSRTHRTTPLDGWSWRVTRFTSEKTTAGSRRR